MTTHRLATLVVSLALVAPASAQTYTWSASASTDWSNAANWSPAGGPPNAAGVVVRFDGTTANPVMNGSFTVGRFTIDRPTGTSFQLFQGAAGNTLTVNNGAAAGIIELLNADPAYFQSVVVPVAIAGNNALHVNVATGQTLFMDREITGAGSAVTVNAGGQGGRVFAFGANAYGGVGSVTTVAGGLLNADDGGALPTNTALVLAGGVFEVSGTWAYTGDPPVLFSRSLGTGLGQVRLTGPAAGFSNWQGVVNIRLNGGAGTITWGDANFDPGVLVLGHADSQYGEVLTFENGLDLNGATRTIRADQTLPSAGSFSRITGVLSNSTGTAGLNKQGLGILELAAANTYNGPTTVSGGVLRAADGVGLPSASNLTLDGGLYESPTAGTFSRSLGTGAGQFQFGPGGGGFSAVVGNLAVRLNNTTAPVTWGAGGFVPAGVPLVFHGPAGDSLVDFQNGIDLGGATRSVVVNPGAGPAAVARLSGVLSSGGLAVSGGGVLELTGANAYSGPTTLTGGVLRANDGHGLPAASNLTLAGGVLEGLGTAAFNRSLGTAAGQVQFTPAGGGFSARGGVHTVQLNGNANPVAWGAAGFVPEGTALTFGSPVADDLTDFRNGLALAAGDRTIRVADNPAVPTDIARVSGVVSNGGLVKTGAGTLHLTGANTYAGTTEVREGAVRAADGVGLATGSNLRLAGGVFEGTGAFTRSLGTGAGQVQFGYNTETFLGGGFAAGGGPLAVNIGGQPAPQTLTWGDGGFAPAGAGLTFGSATADAVVEFRNPIDLNFSNSRDITVLATPGRPGAYARISGEILGGGGFYKYGAGTLELTAENTFSGGGVRVSEGRLLVNNPDRTGAASVGVSSGTGIGGIEVDNGATLGGSGRIELQNSPGFFNYGSRLVPGGPAGTGLRIDVNGAAGFVFFDGTWVMRVTAAGTGGVALNSGGSTAGTAPDPTNHNFLDLHTYTGTPAPVEDAFDFSFATFEVDGTGANFTLGQRYSYKVGRVGALAELDGGSLDVTDQDRFVAVGFQATDFSLTAGPDGFIYLNFTPVPEPALALALAAAGLVAGTRWRAVRR